MPRLIRGNKTEGHRRTLMGELSLRTDEPGGRRTWEADAFCTFSFSARSAERASASRALCSRRTLACSSSTLTPRLID